MTPAPAKPRSIGRLGAGACTIVWQRAQANLGRTWRMTLKLPGWYFSTSEASWPIWRSPAPHPGQAQSPDAR